MNNSNFNNYFFEYLISRTQNDNMLQQVNNLSILNLLDDFMGDIHDYLSLSETIEAQQRLFNLNEQQQENVKIVVPDNFLDNLKSDSFNKNKHLLNNCTICLDNFEDNEKIILLECNHNFHKNCIEKWLKEYSYKCPLCRNESSEKVYKTT